MQPFSNHLDTAVPRWHFATMPRSKRTAADAPDVPITVRFPAKLRDDLKAAADADGRSFNAFVVRALQAAIERDRKRRD